MPSSFSSSSQPGAVGMLGRCDGCPPSPPCPRLTPRPRPRRVLYPPGVRKTMPKEASDPARRWLLLLSTLLFLQIYTEEELREPEQQAQDGLSALGEGAAQRPLGTPETPAVSRWGPNTHGWPGECRP